MFKLLKSLANFDSFVEGVHIFQLVCRMECEILILFAGGTLLQPRKSRFSMVGKFAMEKNG